MRKPVFRLLAAWLVLWCGAHSFSILADEEPEQGIAQSYAQEWRVLPGESLRSLAALFYPKDRRMQQRFVEATLSMNRDRLGSRSAEQPFEQETTIRIPELRALSFQKGAPEARVKPKAMPSGARSGAAATANTASGKGYDAVAKHNQARKKELETLNRRLQKLEEHSRALQQSLPADTPPGGESKSKSLKRVPAPDRAAPGVALATLLGTLLVAGYASYRWHRRRGREMLLKPAPVKPEIVKFPEPALAGRSAAAPVAAQPGQSKPAAQTNHISVDEIESVVEEARVIVALGRTANAIKLLTDYLESYPRASVNPWLYLLDLYRATGNRNEFAETGRRMHQAFNVMVPAWEMDEIPVTAPLSLEEFPHVMQKIEAAWGRPECSEYLLHLLQDNRGGERTGFSMNVLQDILLLQAVLEVRD